MQLAVVPTRTRFAGRSHSWRARATGLGRTRILQNTPAETSMMASRLKDLLGRREVRGWCNLQQPDSVITCQRIADEAKQGSHDGRLHAVQPRVPRFST
ncbi:hypothetical protein IF2G_04613 [Cordyceps javanica]|nr:hypothetical protein IF2G_04613 [Cordyceps javanica]